jgi:hypothetical protein
LQRTNFWKKIAPVRVVDGRGKYLKLFRAFIRSLPIVLLVNGYHIMFLIITEQNNLYIPVLCLLTAILAGTFSFILLLPNRQGPHDMLVYSQVIPSRRTINISKETDWPLMLMFVSIMIAFLVFLLN